MDYNGNEKKIDLHIHSTASDGTLSPLEIIGMAQSLNLSAIAITDHDTIDGSKSAISFQIPSSIKFLTGVEISASPPANFTCSGSFHILGYAINLNDTELNRILGTLQNARKNRNPQIIERLNKFGMDLTLDEIRKDAGEGQLGRPHIARYMVKKGYVESIKEAFNQYLGKGKPAYVDKFRLDCTKALKIIIDAGGMPVLAHPVLIQLKNNKRIEDLIITLKEMGLKGIEVYYPEHTTDITRRYIKIAKQNDLLITGGTDFHGSLKPEIKMGSGRGNLSIPYSLYEKLVECNLQGA